MSCCVCVSVCVCVFTCVSVCVCVCENSAFLGGGRGVFSAVVIAFYFLCVHVFILNVCSLIDLCVMALMECVCVCAHVRAHTHMWCFLACIYLHVALRYIYIYLNFNMPRYVVEWELQVRQ